MTNIELALANLGEATAVEFHKKNNSQGLKELKQDMNKAGIVLKSAKKEIEKELESSVIQEKNYAKLTDDSKNK